MESRVAARKATMKGKMVDNCLYKLIGKWNQGCRPARKATTTGKVVKHKAYDRKMENNSRQPP